MLAEKGELKPLLTVGGEGLKLYASVSATGQRDNIAVP
jgi:hypothetical protein